MDQLSMPPLGLGINTRSIAAAVCLLAVSACTEDNAAPPGAGFGGDFMIVGEAPPSGVDGTMMIDADADVDLQVTSPQDLTTVPPPPPSCAKLGTPCGPQHAEDCCTSLYVPEGVFDRSNDARYPAMVSPFKLDRFEATVGRIRAFVASGRGTQATPPQPGDGAHPRIPNSGWNAMWNTSLPIDKADFMAQLKCDPNNQTWTNLPGIDTKPANCISWFVAFAFCAWDGGRLPTEAEWNYAAAGGIQRPYPWSVSKVDTAIDAAHAVYGGAAIQPVGSKSPVGDGQWGHADLAGSAQEWVLDSYAVPYPTPCFDCANLAMTGTRVLRGGGWSSGAAVVRTEGRAFVTPVNTDNGGGVRCARD